MEITAITMKECNLCDTILPVDCFNKDKSRKDGLATKCRACAKDMHKRWYASLEAKVIVRKNNANFAKTEKYREGERKKAARMRKKHPLKYKARYQLNNAMGRGEIVKLGCGLEIFGWLCQGRIEGHHTDYSKPLDVQWLCKRHHILADKIARLCQL